MNQRGNVVRALIVFLTIIHTAAADTSWNATTGTWSNGSHWSGGLPDASDNYIYLRYGGSSVCTLNTIEGLLPSRLVMQNGQTLDIASGGRVGTAWARVGHESGAAVNLTGNGSFVMNEDDLWLGTDGGHGTWTMADTSSLTTISNDGGSPEELFIADDGGSATFKLVGSSVTIAVEGLHLGINSGTPHAVLEFAMDAGGASPIVTTAAGIAEAGTAELVLRADAALAEQDILLIETTGPDSIGGNGVFNAMNGGPAAEGTALMLGGNLYSLTYAYDAAGDETDNDIALVFLESADDWATSPFPQSDAEMNPDEIAHLSWQPGQGAIRSEVYFGTDPTAVAAAQRPAGDVDGDGQADMTDLAQIAAQWLSASIAPCPDLDYSGRVDLPDLAALARDWGQAADSLYRGATAGDTFDPGPLDGDTAYYWRVDSVYCDRIEPGEIWTFRTAAPPVLAFPGAEGFGAQANGGRGGDVYTVVNLDSSGPGSLRYGIENAPAGGRTIVFAVSGYIPISYNDDTGNQTLRIVRDNVTIAGQTAPGDGIGLKDGRILITGDDAVIRHIRVRHGKYGAAGDCINIESSAENTIIDHVSLMFSTDENISFFNSAVDQFTMQYCTSSWGMERHNAGGLWDMVNGSCHHSLWAHHSTRNPKARPYGLLEWINNVTFHWRKEGFIMGDSESNVDWYANIIGCYYLSIADYAFGLDTTPLSKARIASDGQPNFHLYLSDTLIDANGDGLLNGTDNGYGIISGSPDLSLTPFAGAPIPVTTDDPLTAYKKVISSAGALRLDAAYAGPLRDELDDLLIESVENQQSILVAKDTPVTTDPDEPPSNGEQHLADVYGISNNGFGTLNTAAAPTDSDGDGMPDFWERSVGSDFTLQNHNAPVPAGAYVSSGYTLLEEYLHFRAVPHVVIPMRTASEPSSLSVDLRRYTRGFNVAPVVFSLSGIRNGSAAIQPDGHTLVFEPALHFSGRARLNFTVTDGDGSTWTQTLAVLVASPPPPASPTGLWAQAADTQVALDWEDNGEANLAGYNVYRTTTSGSAYVQVNTSPVTASAYTDTDVLNGTLYHYVVTAVDALMHESAASSEVSAAPAATPSLIIQEYTAGFCSVDGTVDNNNAGFTGAGFANTDNAVGKGVTWTVSIPSAGTCTITWRCANGSSDRPADLLVNNVQTAANISFSSTGDWETWNRVSRTVNLPAGTQTLRLQAAGSGGLANIDYIEISGVGVIPAECP